MICTLVMTNGRRRPRFGDTPPPPPPPPPPTRWQRLRDWLLAILWAMAEAHAMMHYRPPSYWRGPRC